MFLFLLLCICIHCVLAQNICGDNSCAGCFNLNAEVKCGAWCHVRVGDPSDDENPGNYCILNTTMCNDASSARATDISICEQTGVQQPTGTTCNSLSQTRCRDECPEGYLLKCECPNNPSVPIATCAEQELGGGIIAAIVLGSICFVGLVVGMIVYGIKTQQDDGVVVVDRQGRKIKKKKPKKNKSINVNNNANNNNNSNFGGGGGGGMMMPSAPEADGLWHCPLDTCNRAYHTGPELDIHVNLRHPEINNSAAMNNGGSVQMGGYSQDPNLGGYDGNAGYDDSNIFKCQHPGCPKGYYNQTDLDTHIAMRHGGVAGGGGSFNGGSFNGGSFNGGSFNGGGGYGNNGGSFNGNMGYPGGGVNGNNVGGYNNGGGGGGWEQQDWRSQF